MKGYTIWKISEQGNGPEKYYRNTKGQWGSTIVENTVESELQNAIGVMCLEEVMHRDNVESRMEEAKAKLLSWGIEVERLKVEWVTVLSKQLREDLEAESFTEMKLKVGFEQIDRKEKEQISKAISELAVFEAQEERRSKEKEHRDNQELKRMYNEAEHWEKKGPLEIRLVKERVEGECEEMEAAL